MENLILDYLYSLTQKEYNGIKLTNHESRGYVTIANYCHKNNIAIKFGIEL